MPLLDRVAKIWKYSWSGQTHSRAMSGYSTLLLAFVLTLIIGIKVPVQFLPWNLAWALIISVSLLHEDWPCTDAGESIWSEPGSRVLYKGQEVSSCWVLRVELWRNASLHSNFIPLLGLLWKEWEIRIHPLKPIVNFAKFLAFQPRVGPSSMLPVRGR
jgi:hypothetical protein